MPDRGQNGPKRDAKDPKDPKIAQNSFQGTPKVSNMLPKCSEGLPVPELQLSCSLQLRRNSAVTH